MNKIDHGREPLFNSDSHILILQLRGVSSCFGLALALGLATVTTISGREAGSDWRWGLGSSLARRFLGLRPLYDFVGRNFGARTSTRPGSWRRGAIWGRGFVTGVRRS